MTSILDFTISYTLDDGQQTSELFVSAPKSYKINTFSNSVPQIKKVWMHISIAIIFLVHNYEGEFRGYFRFFLSNLLDSNVYS